MYDELVKRLWECASGECFNCSQSTETTNASVCSKELMKQAADAIEELSLTAESYKRSMEAWADEAANVQPRWIPVTERLPDSGVCVLVTDGLEVGEGWITEITNTKGYFSRWCCPTADIDVDWHPITHWMPLPTPPTAEEGE